PMSPLFPYTALFRSALVQARRQAFALDVGDETGIVATGERRLDRGVAGRGRAQAIVELRFHLDAFCGHGIVQVAATRSGMAGRRDRKSTRLNSSHVK